MSENIKAKKGKAYLQTPEGLELIGETNSEEFDVYIEPNMDHMPAIFPVLAGLCKHRKPGYDRDHQLVDTCRRPNNTPTGCSWGDCRPAVCPVWR